MKNPLNKKKQSAKMVFDTCPNCKDGKIGDKKCIACRGSGKRFQFPGVDSPSRK